MCVGVVHEGVIINELRPRGYRLRFEALVAARSLLGGAHVVRDCRDDRWGARQVTPSVRKPHTTHFLLASLPRTTKYENMTDNRNDKTQAASDADQPVGEDMTSPSVTSSGAIQPKSCGGDGRAREREETLAAGTTTRTALATAGPGTVIGKVGGRREADDEESSTSTGIKRRRPNTEGIRYSMRLENRRKRSNNDDNELGERLGSNLEAITKRRKTEEARRIIGEEAHHHRENLGYEQQGPRRTRKEERRWRIKILIANLYRSRMAHDMLKQSVIESGVDYVIITELRIIEKAWEADKNGDVAIWKVGKVGRSAIALKGEGYLGIIEDEVLLIGGYLSLNIVLEDFKEKLSQIEREALMEASHHVENGTILMAGDFNAKSTQWGGCKNDARGHELLRMQENLGMKPLRARGRNSYFHVGRQSFLDIMSIGSGLKKENDPKILDRYSGSDHRFVLHEVSKERKTKGKATCKVTGYKTDRLQDEDEYERIRRKMCELMQVEGRSIEETTHP